MKPIDAGIAERLVILVVALGLCGATASAAGPNKRNASAAASSTVRVNIHGRCPAHLKRALIGPWRFVRGDGPLVEMQFFARPQEAPEFRSWFNARPEMYGRWELNGCRVTIVDRKADIKSVSFMILRMQAWTMTVRFDDSDGTVVYKRI